MNTTKTIIVILFSLFLFSGAFAFTSTGHFIDGNKIFEGQSVNTLNPFEYKITIFNKTAGIDPVYGNGFGFGKMHSPSNPIVCRFVVKAEKAGQYAGQLVVNGVAVVDKNENLFNAVNPPAPILTGGSSGFTHDIILFPDVNYNGNSSNRIISSSNNACEPDWSCGVWSNCMPNGLQTRECFDLKDCNSLKNKPRVSKTCNSNPVQNQEFLISDNAGTNGNNGLQSSATGFFVFGNNWILGLLVLLLIFLLYFYRKKIAALFKKK